MTDDLRYYDAKLEPEILPVGLIAPCPACNGSPVAIIHKPLQNKYNWEIKTDIACRNEDCVVKPKVTGCVVRRNHYLAHAIQTSQVATQMAYDKWPPTVNKRFKRNGE